MNQFTEKDLAYITDMFSWNLQALKLTNHFMNEVEKEEVKELLEEIFDMHYENLNYCINILNGNYQNDDEYDREDEDETEEIDEDEDSYEEDKEEEEEDE